MDDDLNAIAALLSGLPYQPPLISNITINNGQNFEEYMFYTPRNISVTPPNQPTTTYDMHSMQCLATRPDGQPCSRTTYVLPYCIYHTVHKCRVIPDFQADGPFAGVGLYAFDPVKLSSDDSSHPTSTSAVFAPGDTIAPFTNIVCGATNTNIIDTPPRYAHRTPHIVTIASNAYDPLIVRPIGAYARTAPSADCNANLQYINGAIWLVATRPIHNTAAILCDYGDDYRHARAHPGNDLPTITYTPDYSLSGTYKSIYRFV